jgi:acyl carrier protein phosphodiesterase
LGIKINRIDYLTGSEPKTVNFLAHLYLSADDPKIMVGNFIGDFVKGRQSMERFEARIVKGIELHRGIQA